MKSLLKAVLINIAVILLISSWPDQSSGWDHFRGEEILGVGPHLRLISMDIPQTLNPTEDAEYWVNIKYDSGMKPEIRRACFNFSGLEESCFDVEDKDVTSKNFRVSIQVPTGTKKINCYAEYFRDGKLSRTNTITYYIINLESPGE